MNKAKRSRWYNPCEGVGTEKGGLRLWVLQLLGRGRGVGARRGARPPYYIYIYCNGTKASVSPSHRTHAEQATPTETSQRREANYQRQSRNAYAIHNRYCESPQHRWDA